jgi:hypothetical protein
MYCASKSLRKTFIIPECPVSIREKGVAKAVVSCAEEGDTEAQSVMSKNVHGHGAATG